MAKKIAAGLK